MCRAGETDCVSAETTVVSFEAEAGRLTIRAEGEYVVSPLIETVTIMGLEEDPGRISVESVGEMLYEWNADTGTISSKNLNVALNGESVLLW